MHTLAIFNPAAGGGRARRRRAQLARLCDAAFGPSEWFETRQRGEASERAARAEMEGVERIVAIGGDGTVSEVLEGLFDAESGERRGRAQLAVLPSGTGDDFARAIGLEGTSGELLRQLRTARPRRLDVGRVEFRDARGRPLRRHFANAASAGLSALAVHLVSAGGSWLPPRLRYFGAGLRALCRYAPGELDLTVAGAPGDPDCGARELRSRALLLAIANGPGFGGGLPIAPSARPDDGWLELVWIEDVPRRRVLRHAYRLLRGTHLEPPFVHCARGTRVCATPVGGARIPLEVDGEASGWLPLHCALLPSTLEVVAPCPPTRVPEPGATRDDQL